MMLFTTPLFLFVFLPCFLMAYYLTPIIYAIDYKTLKIKHQLTRAETITIQNAVALVGSIVFFAWGEPIFVFLLFLGTYIDYRISLYLSPSYEMNSNYKKILLAAAISLNVLLLILSKYLNFICGELSHWISISVPNLPLILGISFITFHKVSYLVDSYQGRAEPPRHFFDCALYIFLFPQLIAGPIIRYHDIGKQIHMRTHSTDDFLAGFLRFSLGLIKKLLLADNLGILSDRVFNLQANALSSSLAWGGMIAYSLQIYFDFSAYSDMAIGLARMIGFRFPENFNRPYIARSITDFWQRWHISLSNWMRLYLYIPLGGNRCAVGRTYLNLWIVFLISGFWHGASWNFIAWGAYYGFFLSLERAWSANSLSQKVVIPSSVRRALTLMIVMIGWVFFRSPSLTYAGDYLLALLGIHGSAVLQHMPWGMFFTNHAISALIVGSLLALCNIPSSYLEHVKTMWLYRYPSNKSGVMAIQFMSIVFLLFFSAGAMMSSNYAPFLYFRF